MPVFGNKFQAKDSHNHAKTNTHVALRVSGFLDYSGRWTIPRACSTGSIRLLARILAQELIDMDPFSRHWLFTNGMAEAAAQGDVRVLQWLTSTYLPHFQHITKAVDAAALNGKLEVVQWLFEHHGSKILWSGRELARAVRGGRLTLAKRIWAIVPGLPTCDREKLLRDKGHLMSFAAENGNLTMVQWLWKILGLCSEAAMQVAADHGHLGVLVWLMGHCFKSLQSISLDDAASNGHFAVVMWLDSHGMCHASKCAMDGAAEGGHLNVMKYLAARRFEGCSVMAMGRAARDGHLHVVRWLHESYSERCTAFAMAKAAIGGHLEVLRYLHAHCAGKCPPFAMEGAAAGGHLQVVKWLHSKGVGCRTKAMDAAALAGRSEVVKWLHMHRTGGCTVAALNEAAGHGHLETARWLSINRADTCTKTAMFSAASCGHLDALKLLEVNHEARYTSEVIDVAARAGHWNWSSGFTAIDGCVIPWICGWMQHELRSSTPCYFFMPSSRNRAHYSRLMLLMLLLLKVIWRFCSGFSTITSSMSISSTATANQAACTRAR